MKKPRKRYTIDFSFTYATLADEESLRLILMEEEGFDAYQEALAAIQERPARGVFEASIFDHETKASVYRKKWPIE